MLHHAELLARRRTDPAGGRVVGGDLGMLAFQRLEPAHQDVVLRVADVGGVEHVIAVVVMADLFAQLLGLRGQFFQRFVVGHDAGRSCFYSLPPRPLSAGRGRLRASRACVLRAYLL